MPIELITMIGGSVTGFIFRYLAERAQERAEIFKMAIGLKKAEIESADAATKRVPIDAGKWVRRTIVMCCLFGVILAPLYTFPLGDVYDCTSRYRTANLVIRFIWWRNRDRVRRA